MNVNEQRTSNFLEKIGVENIYYASFKLVVFPLRNKECRIVLLHTGKSSVPLEENTMKGPKYSKTWL